MDDAAEKSSNAVSMKIERPEPCRVLEIVGFDNFSGALTTSHMYRRFLICIDDFINALDICSADIDDFCPDSTRGGQSGSTYQKHTAKRSFWNDHPVCAFNRWPSATSS